MDNEKEAERRRLARPALAIKLHDVLGFALNTNLTSEAAIIAKLIEATLSNTAIDMHIKLTS